MMPRFSRLAVAGLGLVVLLALAGWVAVWGLGWPAAPTPAPVEMATATAWPTRTVTTPAATQPPRPTVAASPTRIGPTATPTPTPGAQVAATAPGLRLRQSPGTAGEVIRELPAATLLVVVGRTADSAWVQVVTPEGEQGWVAAGYLDLFVKLELLPVTGQAANAASAIPYISGVTAHARQIFEAGQARGNRAFAFSLVGDSNTDNPAFLAPFDQGNYDLGAYADLQATVGYFQGSFARDSAAALGGFSTAKALDSAYADSRCAGGETPLACEYRLQQPSVALILLGTGDQHDWAGFEARYRQIIEYTIEQGIVPALITKADDLENTEDTAAPGFINSVIVRLSQEYDVPLLNLRQAVDPLPNRGCKADGFHYNTPPDGQSANFTGDHLNYGFNLRNLTALQMLDALRRYVLY